MNLISITSEYDDDKDDDDEESYNNTKKKLKHTQLFTKNHNK